MKLVTKSRVQHVVIGFVTLDVFVERETSPSQNITLCRWKARADRALRESHYGTAWLLKIHFKMNYNKLSQMQVPIVEMT